MRLRRRHNVYYRQRFQLLRKRVVLFVGQLLERLYHGLITRARIRFEELATLSEQSVSKRSICGRTSSYRFSISDNQFVTTTVSMPVPDDDVTPIITNDWPSGMTSYRAWF